MTRQETIRGKVEAALAPSHLEVIDESHMHSVPQGAESHFKVIVVSERFEGERLLNRHRMVNRALAEEFNNGLHALALHTMTPDEWFEKAGKAADSPECMGGSKS
ncbi:MAG: BolA family transcriptional regulator [Chromatiales bacterium]|nr:BolA family transcriptional regulator [Chromatiales bacterium]